MNKLKVLLFSSALALSLGQTVEANYTQEHLVELRAHVDANDTDAILAFIAANPQIINGASPLSEALKDFSKSRDGLFGGFFGDSVPDLSGVPDVPAGETFDTALESGSLSEFGS